jgi:hypothetical protein
MNHFLWRRIQAEHFQARSQGERPGRERRPLCGHAWNCLCMQQEEKRQELLEGKNQKLRITPRETPAEVKPDA